MKGPSLLESRRGAGFITGCLARVPNRCQLTSPLISSGVRWIQRGCTEAGFQASSAAQSDTGNLKPRTRKSAAQCHPVTGASAERIPLIGRPDPAASSGQSRVRTGPGSKHNSQAFHAKGTEAWLETWVHPERWPSPHTDQVLNAGFATDWWCVTLSDSSSLSECCFPCL